MGFDYQRESEGGNGGLEVPSEIAEEEGRVWKRRSRGKESGTGASNRYDGGA